jgi:hypothetical protein
MRCGKISHESHSTESRRVIELDSNAKTASLTDPLVMSSTTSLLSLSLYAVIVVLLPTMMPNQEVIEYCESRLHCCDRRVKQFLILSLLTKFGHERNDKREIQTTLFVCERQETTGFLTWSLSLCCCPSSCVEFYFLCWVSFVKTLRRRWWWSLKREGDCNEWEWRGFGRLKDIAGKETDSPDKSRENNNGSKYWNNGGRICVVGKVLTD